MSDVYEFSADADEDAEANEDTDIRPNNINIFILQLLIASLLEHLLRG